MKLAEEVISITVSQGYFPSPDENRNIVEGINLLEINGEGAVYTNQIRELEFLHYPVQAVMDKSFGIGRKNISMIPFCLQEINVLQNYFDEPIFLPEKKDVI